MNYEDLMSKALKGRSVNATAKAWNVPQRTLDQYTKGESIPDHQTTLIIAAEAGVPVAAVVAILAAKEAEKKKRVNLFFTGNTPEAAPVLKVQGGTLCIMSNRRKKKRSGMSFTKRIVEALQAAWTSPKTATAAT